MTKQRQYNICLNNKRIDSVFYTLSKTKLDDRIEYVKTSLINHDGYDPNIRVKEAI